MYDWVEYSKSESGPPGQYLEQNVEREEMRHNKNKDQVKVDVCMLNTVKIN